MSKACHLVSTRLDAPGGRLIQSSDAAAVEGTYLLFGLLLRWGGRCHRGCIGLRGYISPPQLFRLCIRTSCARRGCHCNGRRTGRSAAVYDLHRVCGVRYEVGSVGAADRPGIALLRLSCIRSSSCRSKERSSKREDPWRGKEELKRERNVPDGEVNGRRKVSQS